MQARPSPAARQRASARPRSRPPAWRARHALLALLVLASAAVAGCQESGFDESKETVRPLKVQHVLGESKVPGQAKEPLTLTADALDDTLALDVRPKRAALPDARLPRYLRTRGAGVALMRPVVAADLPAVEAVHPDLIIGSASTSTTPGPPVLDQTRIYDRLIRIAPTVMIALGGGQWKLNVRLVGEALGRTNDAEQLLTDYDREAALARKAIREAREAGGAGGRTRRPRVAVALLTAGGLRFARRDSFAGTILADAGVKQVRSAAGADVTLLAETPDAKARPSGRFTDVDRELWWGPGGAIAAKAALDDLRLALAR